MTEKRRLILTFSGMLVLFSLIYMPVLQGYYVYHDDYWGIAWDKISCSDYQISKVMNELGRFVGGYLTCYIWMFVDTINEARGARFVNVLLLSALAFTTYLWLCKNQTDRVHALLLSVMIYTLPTFQSLVSIVNGIMHFIGLLLSMASILLAYKALSISVSKRSKAILIFVSIVLLLITLHMHQSFTLFYWPLVAILLLRITAESWRQWRLPIIYLFGINLIAQFLFFVLYKKFYETPYAVGYTGTISVHLIYEKVKWFLHEPLVDALNLWNIFPSPTVTILVAAVIIIWIFAEAAMTIRGGSGLVREKIFIIFSKFFLLLCLLLLCQLPYLVIARSLSFYRGLAGLAPLIVIMLFGAVSYLLHFLEAGVARKAITSVLVICCMTGIFYAHNNVMNYIVIPQTVELRYIKSQLQQSDLSHIRQVHIIHSRIGDPLYSDTPRYDEFAVSATSYETDVPNMVNVALNELDKGSFMSDIVITQGTDDRIPFYDERLLVIDMRAFRYFY